MIIKLSVAKQNNHISSYYCNTAFLLDKCNVFIWLLGHSQPITELHLQDELG